jgi:hypothetical protein
MLMLLSNWESVKMPSEMLEAPGLDECPPLRTAKRALQKVTIRNMFDTSSAFLGRTTQFGNCQHV